MMHNNVKCLLWIFYYGNHCILFFSPVFTKRSSYSKEQATKTLA